MYSSHWKLSGENSAATGWWWCETPALMDRDTLDTVSADYLFSSNLAADTDSSSQGGTMQRIGPSPVCILTWWEGWCCTVWLQLAAATYSSAPARCSPSGRGGGVTQRSELRTLTRKLVFKCPSGPTFSTCQCWQPSQPSHRLFSFATLDSELNTAQYWLPEYWWHEVSK